MYEDFYGLRGRPFALTPDPRFLLLTSRHRETLSVVKYVLDGRAGLALLVGEAGSGKTTLLRAVLDEAGAAGGRVVLVDNPLLERHEFFELLAHGFSLGSEAARSKARLLLELRRVLGERLDRGGRSALVVDEAQDLTDELLEEIRLLANLESRGTPLLPIVLAGHPELAHRLDEPAMAALRQRIELRAVAGSFSLAETADYIAGRLRLCGGDIRHTFTRSAVEAVFAASAGLPRPIGVICESALVTGFAIGARPIDRDVVIEVCRDLELPFTDGEPPVSRGNGSASGVPVSSASPDLAAAPAAASAPPEPREAAGDRPATAELPASEDRSTGVPASALRGWDEDGPGPELPGREAGVPSGRGAPSNGAAESVERAPDGRSVQPAPRGLGRRVLGLLSFPRSRQRGPLRLEVQYFDAGSHRGFVVTPATRAAR